MNLWCAIRGRHGVPVRVAAHKIMAKAKSSKRGAATLAENRRARFNYEILETFTAGLVLQGWEVKAARNGRAQISESYVAVSRGELFLLGSHFSPLLSTSTHTAADPVRSRKLLMTAREIRRLTGKIQQAGMTIAPLDLHLSRGKIKLRAGLARGKKTHDKRATVQQRDWQRQQQRILKGGR